MQSLGGDFEREAAVQLDATFGAVGAIKAKLDAGAPCDALILTLPMLERLAEAGTVERDSIAALGTVRTGVAVRTDDPKPAIATSDALREAFIRADELFLPDPVLATAGIHCMKVLEQLGIGAEMAAKLRPHVNGAAAMAALARTTSAHPIGCTQVSEILYTPGVGLVGMLPKAFELATVYAIAVTRHAAMPGQARRLAALLTTGSDSQRAAAGFESA